MLVTGAAGFIGSWVVRSLLKHGVDAVLTDVKRDFSRLGVLAPGAESLPYVEGDITDPELIPRIVETHGVDRVIHLAALQIPACRQDPVQGARINVLGTLHVFEAAKRTGRIKRIAYASSAAVYGPPELYGGGRVPVDAPLKPMTHYGAFKVCNELSANAYWVDHGIPSACLRPHTVYGFGRDVGVTSDVTKALKAALLGRSFRIRFGGVADLQYAADVAEAFVRCVLKDLDGARVYNIRGTPMRIADVVGLIEELVPEARGLITHEEKPLPIVAELDDASLRRDIEGIPNTPVREGFRETLGIFRSLLEEGRLDASDLAQ